MSRAACVIWACAVCACGPNRGGGNSLEPGLTWIVAVEASEGARVNAVAIGEQGQIIVAGEFSGTIELGASEATSAGGRDGFIARLDAASGELQWLRRIGGPGDDRIRAVAVAADGAVAFGGELVGRVSVGEIEIIAAGQPDGMIGHVGGDGSFDWIKAIGGTRFGAIAAITFVASGDIVAAGSFGGQMTLTGRTVYAAGGHDIVVARLRRAGGVVWAKRAGGLGADIARAVAQLPDGGVAIAGSVMHGAAFGATTLVLDQPAADLFVANIDGDGRFRWATHAGGEQNDSAAAIVVADGIPVAGGRSVPALVKASEQGALESATPLPDILEVTALAYARRLFAARVVANPIGVGGGVAITAGLLDGRTKTVNLASSGAVSASGLAAREEQVVVVGSFREDLSARDKQLKSDKQAGFVASYRWP